jgi:hypothetical protein
LGSVLQWPLLQKPLWSPRKALGSVLQGSCVVCHILLLITDVLALLESPCIDALNAKGLFIQVCALPVKVAISFASCAINEEVPVAHGGFCWFCYFYFVLLSHLQKLRLLVKSN